MRGEMKRLAQILRADGAPFEIVSEPDGCDHMLIPSAEDPKVSIICNKWSYGGAVGLLEVGYCENGHVVDTDGNMTASQSYESIERYMREHG